MTVNETAAAKKAKILPESTMKSQDMKDDTNGAAFFSTWLVVHKINDD